MKIKRMLSKEFIKFLSTLLLFILFACIMSMILYNIFTSTLIQIETKRVEENLTNTSNLIDVQLNEIKNTFKGIIGNIYTQKFMNLKKPFRDIDNFTIWEAYTNFHKEGQYSDFIQDIYIFNTKSDLIYSSKYATCSANTYYNLLLGYSGMTYDEWKDKINSTYYQNSLLPAAEINITNTKKDYFTYAQTYPTGNSGVLLALIPVDNILQYLKSIISEEGWVTIADKNGSLLYIHNISGKDLPSNLANHSIVKMNQTNMLIITDIAKASGLKYTIAIPTSLYLGQLDETQQIMFICIVIFCIIGILSAFLLAYYTNLPIRKLVNTLQSTQPKGTKGTFFSEYSIISSSLDFLKNENSSLYGRIRSYTPMVEFLVLRQLMLGEKRWEEFSEEVKAIFIDITLWQRYQMIGIIINSDTTNLNFANGVILQELLRTIFEDKYKMVSFPNGTFFILATWPSDEKGIIQKNLESIHEKALAYYGISLIFGCSNIYLNVGDIASCYIEAVQALKYRQLNGNIIWFGDIHLKLQTSSISIDEERNLINLVRSGNQDELEVTIPVFNQRNLTFENRGNNNEKLSMQLLVIIHRIADELPMNDFVQQITMRFEESLVGESDINNVKNSFRVTLLKLCEQFKINRKSQNSILKHKMSEYISDNFINPNLSAQTIADTLNISVSYLYHFFKEQFGENYADYLERIRMDYCVRLMSNKKLALREIAKMCGYENTNTFYKAFKRVFGVSPKIYRDTKIV